MASFDLKDLEPTDWATGLGQIYNRQTQQLETFIQQSQQRDAQQEAKTKASGEMLQTLAKFSATATEAVMKGQEKREKKERDRIYGKLAEIGVTPFQAAQHHLQKEDANNKDNQIVNKFGETITLSDSVKQELEVILGRNERRTREVLAMSLGNNWGAIMEASGYSARLKAAANNPGLGTEIRGEAYNRYFGKKGLNLKPEVYQTYASKGVNDYYNGTKSRSQSKGNSSAKIAYTNTHVQHLTESAISQTGLATKSFIETRGIIEAGLPQYPGVDNKKEASEIALGHLKTAYTSGTLTSNNFQAELDYEVPCGSLHAGRCYNNQAGKSVTTLRRAYFGEGGENVKEWVSDIDKAFGEHSKDLIKIEKNSINGEAFLLIQDPNFAKLPLEEQQKRLASLGSRWNKVSNEENPMINSAVQRILYPDKHKNDDQKIAEMIKGHRYDEAKTYLQNINDPFLKAKYSRDMEFGEFKRKNSGAIFENIKRSIFAVTNDAKDWDPKIPLTFESLTIQHDLDQIANNILRELWEKDPSTAIVEANRLIKSEWEDNGGGIKLTNSTTEEDRKKYEHLKYVFNVSNQNIKDGNGKVIKGFFNLQPYTDKKVQGLREFNRPINKALFEQSKLEVDKVLAANGLNKDNWTVEKLDEFLLTNADQFLSIPDLIAIKDRGALSAEALIKADILGIDAVQLYEYAIFSLSRSEEGKQAIKKYDLLLKDDDKSLDEVIKELLGDNKKEEKLLKKYTLYKSPIFHKRATLLSAKSLHNVEVNQKLFQQPFVPIRHMLYAKDQERMRKEIEAKLGKRSDEIPLPPPPDIG